MIQTCENCGKRLKNRTRNFCSTKCWDEYAEFHENIDSFYDP